MLMEKDRAFTPMFTFDIAQSCPVCSGYMGKILDFPKMPLCEANDGTAIGQSLLYCKGCDHAKLGTIVAPEILYGSYAATAKSLGSSAGVRNFAGFIKREIEGQPDCVVDIGGNDGSLLAHFEGRKILIDPNASEGPHDSIKNYFEMCELHFAGRKLILSSHTLEHIENPDKVFKKLGEIASKEDVCAFQFPSLELLAQDARIDQIYHQHIHYYSLRSISLLLAKHGFEIVAHEFDASHYGALMIVFRKGLGEAMGGKIASLGFANDAFRKSAESLNARLGTGELIGYGASQMLPLLHYYLPNLSRLKYIVDEDEEKVGFWYAKPKLEVRHFHNMTGKSVVVTAFNTKQAVRSIVQKLLHMNARDVIVPFNYL